MECSFVMCLCRSLSCLLVTYLQWTEIGPSWPNCSFVLCTWPMKSMKPSPDFGTPCSGQSVNWNCLTVRDCPSWEEKHHSEKWKNDKQKAVEVKLNFPPPPYHDDPMPLWVLRCKMAFLRKTCAQVPSFKASGKMFCCRRCLLFHMNLLNINTEDANSFDVLLLTGCLKNRL